MTDTTRDVGATIPGQTSRRAPVPEPTGWVGWVVFAATMMVMIGAFQAIEGFVAIFKDQYFVAPKKDLVVTVDYTAWGWTHLIIGLIIIAAGVALFSGRMWARVIAVLMAGVSAVVNLAFVNAAPVWSSIIIALDVLVIWAVTVHGREMKALR